MPHLRRVVCSWPAVLLVVLAGRGARAEGGASAAEGSGERHGPWEMRVSLESPIYEHRGDLSTNVFKETELEPCAMISYVLEEQRLSFDLEIGEGFVVQSVGDDGTRRTGTTIRPGMAYKPFETDPFFVTALLPVHLEPSPVVLSLRVGAGIDWHTSIGKWFLEADLDLPLAGGTGAPDAFAEQAVVLATGLLFHLPG